jgi:hypothetical protein
MSGFLGLRPLLVLSGLLAVLAACETPVRTAGLRAVHPAPDRDYVVVESVRPTFRWEAFPPAEMIEGMAEDLVPGIADVTYEVRIWRAENDVPDSLVYARAGLIETRHRIETELAPSRSYQWSVRARFELNGEKRVSAWGMIAQLCRVRDSQVPSRCYYRFSTPAAP